MKIDKGGGIEKTFRSQVITCTSSLVERESQCCTKTVGGMVAIRGAIQEIPRASLKPKAVMRSNRFQQSRFA